MFADIFDTDEDDDTQESEYFFADSNSRYLTKDELSGMTLQEVYYAKCEIYARRGRTFDTQELSDFFNAKSWYSASVPKGQFSTSVFNSFEKKNILLLDEYEHELDANGYQPK